MTAHIAYRSGFKTSYSNKNCGYIELIDTSDAKSSGFCIHAGSIPAPAPKHKKGWLKISQPFLCSIGYIGSIGFIR
jgi:hypothetical protein